MIPLIFIATQLTEPTWPQLQEELVLVQSLAVLLQVLIYLSPFLVDEGAVLDAWEWMYQKSLEEGKRLVVNMSWGLYHAGTLDGNSVLSTAISAYTDLGVVFVNSGGNNGD